MSRTICAGAGTIKKRSTCSLNRTRITTAICSLNHLFSNSTAAAARWADKRQQLSNDSTRSSKQSSHADTHRNGTHRTHTGSNTRTRHSPQHTRSSTSTTASKKPQTVVGAHSPAPGNYSMSITIRDTNHTL